MSSFASRVLLTAIIIGVELSLFVIRIDNSGYGDEAYYLGVARDLWQGDGFRRQGLNDDEMFGDNPVAIPLAIAPAFAFSDSPMRLARVIFCLLFVATPLVATVWMLSGISLESASVFWLCLFLNGFQESSPTVVINLDWPLALYSAATLVAIARGRSRIVCASLACVAAICKYQSIVLFVTVVIAYLVLRPRRREAFAAATGMAIAMAAWLAIAFTFGATPFDDNTNRFGLGHGWLAFIESKRGIPLGNLVRDALLRYLTLPFILLATHSLFVKGRRTAAIFIFHSFLTLTFNIISAALPASFKWYLSPAIPSLGLACAWYFQTSRLSPSIVLTAIPIIVGAKLSTPIVPFAFIGPTLVLTGTLFLTFGKEHRIMAVISALAFVYSALPFHNYSFASDQNYTSLRRLVQETSGVPHELASWHDNRFVFVVGHGVKNVAYSSDKEFQSVEFVVLQENWQNQIKPPFPPTTRDVIEKRLDSGFTKIAQDGRYILYHRNSVQ